MAKAAGSEALGDQPPRLLVVQIRGLAALRLELERVAEQHVGLDQREVYVTKPSGVTARLFEGGLEDLDRPVVVAVAPQLLRLLERGRNRVRRSRGARGSRRGVGIRRGGGVRRRCRGGR